METLVVTGDHISELLRRLGADELMRSMTEHLQQACQSFDARVLQVRQRDGFHYHIPRLGLLEWMPCMHLGHQISVKMVAYHPENPQRSRLPTILSTLHIYDPATGHLCGLVDGTFLTALRTGAASCVASRILARPDSQTVGIIGCGAQAVTQLHALSLEYDLRQVLIHDIDPRAQGSFQQRVEHFLGDGIEIRPAPVDLIVQSVDILVTATSQAPGESPLFDDIATRPWLHVNAIGSDFPGKVELPLHLLDRSLVCPDDRDQAMQEGECQRLTADQIGPELWELVQAADAHRSYQQQLTIFDSTGWSLEDQVAGNLLLRLAQEQGLCQSLQLERITRDPLNPYDRQAFSARALPRDIGIKS